MNYRVLSQTEKSEVGILNDEYIVKLRPRGKLDHEYHVGLKLNQLNSPHFVKTISLEEHPTRSGIDVLYMSKVSGETLDKFAVTPLLIYHLILILCDAAHRIGFNHNDLYKTNIIVSESDLKKFRYCTPIGKKKIKSPYRITLIDYELSYIDGVNNEWASVRLEHIIVGLIPSVRDDFNDLIYIAIKYLVMKDICPNPTEFNNLAIKYGFHPYIKEDSIHPYLYGRGNNQNWKILFDKDVITNKSEAKFYLTDRPSDVKLCNFINYVYEQLAMKYNRRKKDYEAINKNAMHDTEIIQWKTQIQIKFGRIMRNLKYQQVQARLHAVREIMMLFDEFFSQN